MFEQKIVAGCVAGAPHQERKGFSLPHGVHVCTEIIIVNALRCSPMMYLDISVNFIMPVYVAYRFIMSFTMYICTITSNCFAIKAQFS